MTKEFAYDMWKQLLERIPKLDEDRMIEDPVYRFDEDVRNGLYDAMDDEELSILRENITDEHKLFYNKRYETANFLFKRAMQTISLNENEIRHITYILAEASVRAQFRS